MTDTNRGDAYENEIMVAGAVWAALACSTLPAEPAFDDGHVTNELYVWPHFMKSRYRITVALDPVVDEETAGRRDG